jgi:hypothetical protein
MKPVSFLPQIETVKPALRPDNLMPLREILNRARILDFMYTFHALLDPLPHLPLLVFNPGSNPPTGELTDRLILNPRHSDLDRTVLILKQSKSVFKMLKTIQPNYSPRSPLISFAQEQLDQLDGSVEIDSVLVADVHGEPMLAYDIFPPQKILMAMQNSVMSRAVNVCRPLTEYIATAPFKDYEITTAAYDAEAVVE